MIKEVKKTIMCGLYYPHPSNTIFISKGRKDDEEGEKKDVKTRKINCKQRKFSMLTLESPPNMIHVCQWWLPKLRCCHSPLQKNHSAKAFSHALNSEDATDLLFFSAAKFFPSLKCPLLSPFILIPLLAFEPPGFLPLQHQNHLHQHGNHTPHYFS